MVGATQVGVGVDQVIGVEPGSPLDPLSTVASLPLDPLSTVASLPLDRLLGVASSRLDLLSAAGPSHLFGVCGVLIAKRRTGIRLSN
jgi:hypothetical protein